MMMININDLPLETFLEILRKIDGKTLGQCRRVCRQWKNIIDDIDLLWQNVCIREFKYSSKIAKRKSGSECKWYHIYKNLVMWSNIASIDKNVREFYNFALHDKCHLLEIESGILPLRDTRGIVLYDMSTMKYMPVVVPEKSCVKISNTGNATAILIKSGLFLQKSMNNSNIMTEAFFKADKFVLIDSALYFSNVRDVFKCDLTFEALSSRHLLHCDSDIKEMQYNNGILYLFTECGKIIKLEKDTIITVKPINCPVEWIKQLKHVCALDDKNFVCYSRLLFKVETDNYKHLYLDFPPITALFFYGDIIIIGTKTGEILLYRLSSQKHASKPIFEKIAELPDGKIAVQLDVCERKSGPVIVAATFFEIIIIEMKFFPHEEFEKSKNTFTESKLVVYKRLLKLRNRLQILEDDYSKRKNNSQH